MIISNLYHQIKNLLLVNKSVLWHGILIFGIFLIWLMAGWFLECDLIGLASDIIQVVTRILPTVPYTESPKIGQSSDGCSTTVRLERVSFFNRKRSSYHLTCEIGSNTIIVDLADMPDLDTDLDSFIIVMDSISNHFQKPQLTYHQILTITLTI